MPTILPKFKDNPAGALVAMAVVAVLLALVPFGAGHFGNAWVRIADMACLR